MSDYARKLLDWMFPVILLVFVGLYVGGLAIGGEPEVTLLRAGLATVVLAGLTRLAGKILDASPATPPAETPPVGATLDVTIGDDAAPPANAAAGTAAAGGITREAA